MTETVDEMEMREVMSQYRGITTFLPTRALTDVAAD